MLNQTARPEHFVPLEQRVIYAEKLPALFRVHQVNSEIKAQL
jgi:hypothetical protein